MLTKLMAYVAKSFRVDGFKGELDGCNIREALLRSTGLCRFSFTVESRKSNRGNGLLNTNQGVGSGRRNARG